MCVLGGSTGSAKNAFAAARDMFEATDTNGNGALDAEELSVLLVALYGQLDGMSYTAG